MKDLTDWNEKDLSPLRKALASQKRRELLLEARQGRIDTEAVVLPGDLTAGQAVWNRPVWNPQSSCPLFNPIVSVDEPQHQNLLERLDQRSAEIASRAQQLTHLSIMQELEIAQHRSDIMALLGPQEIPSESWSMASESHLCGESSGTCLRPVSSLLSSQPKAVHVDVEVVQSSHPLGQGHFELPPLLTNNENTIDFLAQRGVVLPEQVSDAPQMMYAWTPQVRQLDETRIVQGYARTPQVPQLDETRIVQGSARTPQVPQLDETRIVQGVDKSRISRADVVQLGKSRIDKGVGRPGRPRSQPAQQVAYAQRQITYAQQTVIVEPIANAAPHYNATPTQKYPATAIHPSYITRNPSLDSLGSSTGSLGGCSVVSLSGSLGSHGVSMGSHASPKGSSRRPLTPPLTLRRMRVPLTSAYGAQVRHGSSTEGSTTASTPLSGTPSRTQLSTLTVPSLCAPSPHLTTLATPLTEAPPPYLPPSIAPQLQGIPSNMITSTANLGNLQVPGLATPLAEAHPPYLPPSIAPQLQGIPSNMITSAANLGNLQVPGLQALSIKNLQFPAHGNQG